MARADVPFDAPLGVSNERGQELRRGFDQRALHLRCGESSWEKRSLAYAACGRRRDFTRKPVKWTPDPMSVTCVDCRMTEEFRAARADRRNRRRVTFRLPPGRS